ncbi:DUF2269 domain-containing protein, partial [Reyranella sp.]|uniref:DUF2269 domain-containing protein n=1 Tax=Reyranella sp. TaxID=1929291 RepID=UPI0027318109
QPVTGLMLAARAGIDLSASWLVATYVLYALAFVCWAPVVALQIRARNLAVQAADANRPLPAEYYRAMRLWFALGWPAFFALLVVFLLMIAKPDLW